MTRTPQLFITLSPSGGLQCELPTTNGTRRVVPMEGKPEDIIRSLQSMLLAQARGEIKVGTQGAPTAHQVKHDLSHHSLAAPGCPFCNLGLQHSQAQCSLSDPKGRARRTATSRRSAATEATIKAYSLPIDPEELGL